VRLAAATCIHKNQLLGVIVSRLMSKYFDELESLWLGLMTRLFNYPQAMTGPCGLIPMSALKGGSHEGSSKRKYDDSASSWGVGGCGGGSELVMAIVADENDYSFVQPRG
jgi:hypothetical protein